MVLAQTLSRAAATEIADRWRTYPYTTATAGPTED